MDSITLRHGKAMSYAHEVWGSRKRYNSSQSDTGCQICTISSEPFLHATSSSIRAASLPISLMIKVLIFSQIIRYKL